MKYFQGEIRDTDHLKSIYKQLSKKHHPDMGGSNDDFVAMKLEYDQLVRIFESKNSILEDNLQLIDDLVEARIAHGYKVGWEYFKFVELASNPDFDDFKYLAEKLGYKAGWAWYKWKEYEEQN